MEIILCWWGTNRPGGPLYAGRMHVVRSNDTKMALCGLPVADVWSRRPATPDHLCPECCLLAMALMFPTFQEHDYPARTRVLLSPILDGPPSSRGLESFSSK